MGTSKEVRKAYYIRNRERILNETKERYSKNPTPSLEYQLNYRKQNKSVITQKARDKRNARLLAAIALLGNECSNCHTQYDPIVYDFHHINPTEKDFTISEGMLLGESRFYKEVNKCQLLCANCHRLVHKKETNAS